VRSAKIPLPVQYTENCRSQKRGTEQIVVENAIYMAYPSVFVVVVCFSESAI